MGEGHEAETAVHVIVRRGLSTIRATRQIASEESVWQQTEIVSRR